MTYERMRRATPVMIAAAQKVEHDEIATYGTLRTWANRLSKNDMAALFKDRLRCRLICALAEARS